MYAYFAATMFCSAFLLFLIEPMFAKLVLPLLGGTPMVWNTCMLFYQTLLLLGYLYAHISVSWLGERRQALVHCLLLAVSLAALPIGLPASLSPPVEGNLALWLIGVLAVSAGIPFFFVSAIAPMLQKWFVATGAKGSHDPYFLYAASNLGSMLALLSYPSLVEPFVGLARQTWLWSAAYASLTLLCAGAAVLVWRGPKCVAAEPAKPAPAAPCPPDETITNARRLRWLALSFCPSSLMLGVTSYLTTDIAAVPLLWVVPLALYLSTFILVFARKKLLPHALMLRLQPFIVLILTVMFPFSVAFAWLIPLHLAAFFVTAMVCHGELANDRPSPARLTEYYLIMSVGGALGGVLNALAAPHLFVTLAEYPLALAIGCWLRPRPASAPQTTASRRLDYAVPAILAASLWAAIVVLDKLGQDTLPVRLGLLAVCALVLFGQSERPARFGLSLAAVFMTLIWIPLDPASVLRQSRNFFGTLTVKREAAQGGAGYHKLFHGYTVHGVQSVLPEAACDPLAYFHRKGPLGQLLASSVVGDDANVAVVGLGSGAVAAYAKPGWRLAFYEIDPEVESLARDDRYFSYLGKCAPQTRVVLGDARLTLARSENNALDLLVMDAFSSDAIPMHLITREALALYLTKLKPDGVFAFHISNKFLNLAPVLANLAADAGLTLLYQDYKPSKEDDRAMRFRTQWAVAARDPSRLAPLVAAGNWQQLGFNPKFGVWTDDFSNILGPLLAR